MEVQNQGMMQAFSSGRRTRLQESLDAVLRNAGPQAMRVEAAGPQIPGGIVGAAKQAAATGVSSAGEEIGASQQGPTAAKQRYLQSQMELHGENRCFTTRSTIIGGRHDKARLSIGCLQA